jgi:hypothetical protein
MTAIGLGLSVWRGQKPLFIVFALYVLLPTVVPIAVFSGSMAVLCAIECKTLPWIAFIVLPASILFLVLPGLVWLGVGAYRSASALAPLSRLVLRSALVASVLWIPLLSWVTFAYFFGVVVQQWT